MTLTPRQAVLSALWLALSGCGGGPRPTEALEVLVPSAPATLDPRFATDAVAVRITRLVHAGLVRLDPSTLEPLPYAASGWSWQGPMTLRVELRAGVRFHSGAPLEAEDVCSTLRAVADPALSSPHRAVVAAIDRCEPEGPLALRVLLREPRATLLTDLEIPVLRRDEAAGGPRPKGDLDGLGPYRVGASGADATRLSASEGGPLSRPSRDLVVRVVHDENARAIRMLAGRADVAPNAVSPQLLSALEERGVRVRSRPGANLTYLLAQNERPQLREGRVRAAIGAAIDRAALVRSLLGGRAQVAETFLPPSSWAYSKPPSPLAFDPAGARRILEEAGVRSLTLLTSTDRQRQTMARAVAQMLGDAGVEVEVVPLDLGVLLHRLSAGDFELAILQIPEMTEPNLLRWFFHSSAIPSREGRAGANRARFASAEVDELLDRASAEPDRAARRPIYEKALRAMERAMPVVPLFHEDQVAALSERASAFEPSAEGRWLGLAELR